MPAPADAAPTELHRRIVYSLLRPAVRLARLVRLPLKTLTGLLRLAYFEELRRDGATQLDVADQLGVSRRTVATLEAEHRSGFLAPEQEVEAARRIEAALRDGPATGPEIAAGLGDADGDGVARLLALLVAEGRVAVHGGLGDARYRLDRRFVSLVREDLHSRIDGLNHILDVVTAAVRARLAGRDPRPTVARTLTFEGTGPVMADLADDLVDTLRRHCTDAEEASLRQGGTDPYAVTLVLAPVPDEP